MNATALLILTVSFLSIIKLSYQLKTPVETPIRNEELDSKRLEIYDGVYLRFPRANSNVTDKLFSIDVDFNKNAEKGRSKNKKLMQRILPLFIMPFLIQSAIVPMFLSMLKFMLLKSMMVGKLALLLIIINAFKNHNSFRGRQEAEMADIHYGYHGNGMEEYGAYIN